MTDYASVINTSGNGLIRAEAREFALALGLVSGFRHNQGAAKARFGAGSRRIAQYTELKVKLPPDNFISYKMPLYASRVLEKQFKNYTAGREIFFYDTKKFTHYRDRMAYGREKLVRLDSHTMQYLWTAVPLAIMFPYAYRKEENHLDFSNFYCITNALDPEANLEEIARYIETVCKISCKAELSGNQALILFNEQDMKNLYELCSATEKNTYKKLKEAKYLIEEDLDG